MVAGPRPVADVRADGGGTPPETHAARLAAEQTFQKGLALLRDGRTASAAIELGRASGLQPDSLEYLLYATWAKARSYREIPGEPEQGALLAIAHQAKKRDPLLAFASYVIGQVSMWGGDDATAKRWFYEALRLDPASDAGKQVRILARRGPASPASPNGERPAAHDEASEPSPRSTAEPPASPAVEAPLAKPAPGRGPKWLATGAALVAIGALAIFAVVRSAPPGAGLPPPPALQPTPAINAAPPVETQRLEPATAPAKSPKAMTEKDPDDARMGTVVLPARAAGHRIFVDGRRAKTEDKADPGDEKPEKFEGVAPLRLHCGQHEIQIGSGGTPETIDLPCGGQVQIE